MSQQDGAQATAYQLSIELPRDDAHRTANLLTELLWPPAEGVGLRLTGPARWRVDAYFTTAPDDDVLERFLRETCGLQNASYDLLELDPIDWVTASQAARPPIAAGRFIVHGSHDRARVGKRQWAIEIDAGQAFGTGQHGTTAGCLIAIDHIARQTPLHRGLDLGTGTGVLAVAMARAGCRSVIASDSDPIAISAAREAIRHNGATGRVRALVADGLNHRLIHNAAPYDVVTANILARPLAGFAGGLARHVQPGGAMVLSGLLHDQAAAITARYRACGFVLAKRIHLDEWTTLVMQRH